MLPQKIVVHKVVVYDRYFIWLNEYNFHDDDHCYEASNELIALICKIPVSAHRALVAFSGLVELPKSNTTELLFIKKKKIELIFVYIYIRKNISLLAWLTTGSVGKFPSIYIKLVYDKVM